MYTDSLVLLGMSCIYSPVSSCFGFVFALTSLVYISSSSSFTNTLVSFTSVSMVLSLFSVSVFPISSFKFLKYWDKRLFSAYSSVLSSSAVLPSISVYVIFLFLATLWLNGSPGSGTTLSSSVSDVYSNSSISVLTFFNKFSISAYSKYLRRDLAFISSISFLTFFRRCLISPSLRLLLRFDSVN